MIFHKDKNGYKYFLDFEQVMRAGNKLTLTVRTYIADIFEVLEQNKDKIEKQYVKTDLLSTLNRAGSNPTEEELEIDEDFCSYDQVVDWVKTSGLLKNQKCARMPGRFMLRTHNMKSYTFKIVYNIKTKESEVTPLDNSNMSYLKFQDAYINVSPTLIKKAVLSSELEYELVAKLLSDEL